MKFKVDHINISIPVLRIIRKKDKLEKVPKAKPISTGSVVVTRNCLDVGYAAETSHGKPTKVYSRYHPLIWLEREYPQYGAVEAVRWYNTGIRMTLEEWCQLSLDLKDDAGFYNYWHNRLKNMQFT